MPTGAGRPAGRRGGFRVSMTQVDLHSGSLASSTGRQVPLVGQPLIGFVLAFIGGLIAGRYLSFRPELLPVAMAAAVLGLMAGWLLNLHQRPRLRRGLILLAAGGLGAVWWSLRVGWIDQEPIDPTMQDWRQLVDVEGVIESAPRIRYETPGAMGRFDYRQPATRFRLRIEGWHGAGRLVVAGGGELSPSQSVSEPSHYPDESPAAATGGDSLDGPRPPLVGSLQVTVPEVDPRFRIGDRVRIQGWLTPLRSPQNPGEIDYASMMLRKGVVGMLSTKTRATVQLLEADASPLGALRSGLSRYASWLLNQATQSAASESSGDNAGGRLNGADWPARDLLHLLLLGRYPDQRTDWQEDFRRTGLMHVLAVSGMHLALLAAGIWRLLGFITGRPRLTLWLTLGAILIYCMIVPGELAIIRSAFMAIAYLLFLLAGRRPAGLTLLALIALLWLLLNPGDLFSPGFQLSYGAVAALMLWTEPLAQRFAGVDPMIPPFSPWHFLRLSAGRAMAANVVPWLICMPALAFHFQQVSTVGAMMTLLTLPLVALLLPLGFAVLVVTAFWPEAGMVGGWLLIELSEILLAMVDGSAGLWGAYFDLPPVSLAWAIGATALGAAVLWGLFAPRRRWLLVCLGFCIAWLFAGPMARKGMDWFGPEPAMRLAMFSVGDGSCYAITCGGRTYVYDCGSSNRMDITPATIAPALWALGVRRVHTLFISHADTDHFAGALELVDQFHVERVITTPMFLRQAAANPRKAPGFLIEELRRRKVEILSAAAGWAQEHGGLKIRAIWPPLDAAYPNDNDNSLSLLLQAGGRRVLLSGDIQQQAMERMLRDRLELAADIVELPHHGSMAPIAPQWLAGVNPSIILQSSGRQRLRIDRWAGLTGRAARYVTARQGMVQITINQEGLMEVKTYLPRK